MTRYFVVALDDQDRPYILASSPSPFYVLGLAARTREERPDLRVVVQDGTRDVEAALVESLAAARRVA